MAQKIVQEMYSYKIIEERREAMRILQEMGYRVKLNKHLEFMAQFEEGSDYEVLSEEELQDLLTEAVEEDGRGLIDDSELVI
jgi:hypothetical protein